MADTSARLGRALLGAAVLGDPGQMPDFTQDRFSWEGHCWERVTDPDLSTALVEDGGDAAAQAAFAARLANILRLNVQNLYVTDEAVIDTAVIGRLFVDLFTAHKIGADELAANAVDVGKLRVTGEMAAAIGSFLELSVDHLTTGSMAGETIDGGTFRGADVIGGILRTSETSAGGAIRIDQANGIRGWDSSGKRTFQVNNNDGSVDIAANLRALNSSNQGVVLVPQTGSQGNAALIFTDDGSLGTNTAAIWRKTYSTAREPLTMRGANGAGVTVQNGLTVEDGSLEVAQGVIAGSEIATPGIVYWNSGGLNLRGENATMALRNDSGGQGCVVAPPIYDRTYSGTSSNVYVTSSGTLGRSTSSRRYKKYISDWAPDPDTVLALQPRRWKPKVGNGDGLIDGEPNGDYYVGFIAEEVDELGLTELVVYSEDEDGNPRPESLAYDRFCAAQQVVIQRQEARLQEQAEQLAAQDARLDALEARLAALEA